MKKIVPVLLVLVIIGVVVGAVFLGLRILLSPKPFLARTPSYQQINVGELLAREKELHGQKVCLTGDYQSGFENSTLNVGRVEVWAVPGADEAASLRCGEITSRLKLCNNTITICGTLATKAATDVLIEQDPEGFYVECCGHLGGWDFEISGE
jgi:hypothetical protein